MDTIYFLLMLVGVAWLAVWSILPPSRARRGWWPFDMRGESEATELTKHAPVSLADGASRPGVKKGGWRHLAQEAGIADIKAGIPVRPSFASAGRRVLAARPGRPPKERGNG